MKNYITLEGAEKLKSELKKLLYEERPELVKVIQWAASNGDRSENGDYIYGKRRLREMDKRIRFLTKRLEASEVIQPEAQAKDRVLFGAYVKVLDEEEREKTFRIVGQDEIDLSRGWISWVSPFAKAVLNSKTGDFVTVQTPHGPQDYEILEFWYEKR